MKELFNYEKLYVVCNYVMYFLITNFLFIISNITVLAFWLFFRSDDLIVNIVLFLISILPFGASFTALLYTMGLLQRNKEISIVRDYFKSYKQNFVQSTFIWCTELIIILMLLINIIYSNIVPMGEIVRIFATVVLIMLLIITPTIYILLSRFNLRTNNLIKTSVFIVFSKLGLTLSNMAIFLFGLVLLIIKPFYTIIIIASIVAYLLMYRNRNMLDRLIDENVNKID